MMAAEALLKDYLDKLSEQYGKGNATEHTYRPTLQALFEKIDAGISATNEPKRIKCGAPDYVVEHNNLTVGYIEAKDINEPLDKIEKDEQLKRYLRALDNLILTDYLEFRWYVQGEKRMCARLGNIKNKKIVLDKNGVKLGEELLRYFIEHRGEQINKPEELAKRMARLTHMIRDIIVDAFEKNEASDSLKDLYKAFQETLLPDLNAESFADMFAQTMAYGLFAARYNHKGKKPFSREDAAKEISKTNPFLRKLFTTIAGPDLDDEPFIGFVNELAQILAYTDMGAVLANFGKRTRQEDPIVHFYETFLSQYDPKLRETRGVYYTPEPVVSYIVRSVDYLLREHFDCPEGLADSTSVTYSYKDDEGRDLIETTPRVVVLDPATGTGTFLYSVIEHIRESYRQKGNAGMWSSYVREYLLPRLFGFELLVAPYAMSHLKLGMQLAAIDLPEVDRKTWAFEFGSDERLGIYLTNTLDEAVKRSDMIFGKYISDEANKAVNIKKKNPVMVVLGNPPYSGHSANKGKWINELLHGIDSQTGRRTGNYFEVDGQPLGERNPKWLNDDYVKFIRFAQWRIEQTGHGIVAFVTNHGYLDNPTFRGMRQSLMQSFDDIYILDLHGNSKKKEKSPDGSKDENVFDIQQGVAIGIFVKRQKKTNLSGIANVYHSHLWGVREVYEKIGSEQKLIGGKYHWLGEKDIVTTNWTKLEIRAPFYLFSPQNIDVLVEYEKGVKINDISLKNSVGIVTARDALTIHWNKEDIWRTVLDFLSLSPEDARIKYKLGQDVRDWKVEMAQKDLKESGPSKFNLLPVLYRPFDIRYTYYTGNSRGFHCMPRKDIMQHMIKNNLAIITSRLTKGEKYKHVQVTRNIAEVICMSPNTSNNGFVFPLYLYPAQNEGLFADNEFSSNPGARLPNLSLAFIKMIKANINLNFLTDGRGDLLNSYGPEDIFDYIYAILNSPTYRERYSEFLKIDFPRLPLTSNIELFRNLCNLGERLVELHLMEKSGKVTARYPVSGNSIVEKIDYTQPVDAPEQGRVWINKEQYFEGIPPEVWDFHIGGYQVCQKWLKDRKGRRLEFNDIMHYQRIIAALLETITLMEQIDETIEEHGGWPIV
ncbi:type ISP restriction/modification enzyme [Tengunoibacter tsumagoiensis]|uniref:site-specific DNA-methyltransferase (adenine-specific) n=1 Tax=Tengunoibacter tsumagoiensis TaxID=2014871 RepID=A0A402AAI7_9CHLR|nr:type ISP restriction/modification enzyme [Tengunoibacter tsumagoiensis]GCE16183.1 DNA methyltransferase [Tengunoibacter tsumagoiensis]